MAVLMCVHAGADPAHFEAAVASIKAQSYEPIRLFLYCDGALSSSHLRTLEKLLDTGAGKDVVLEGAEPVGLASGLNKLIDCALESPEVAFLARMDADDLSVAERLQRQVDYFGVRPDVEVIGTWCVEFEAPEKTLFYKKLPTSHEQLAEFMLLRSPFNHPSVMFRRGVLERGFRYNPKLSQMQDYDLWARLVKSGVVIGNLPEFLLWFRIDANFYARRSGWRRASQEIRMRIDYARSVGKLRLTNLPRYGGLFLLRVAPAWAKELGYKYLRSI